MLSAMRPAARPLSQRTKRFANTATKPIFGDFGAMAFDQKKIQASIPPALFKRYKTALAQNQPMDEEVVDAIANALKEWAVSNGVTHFSHWFQPLTGGIAEKHDSFINPSADGALALFKGKTLACGETDGSSFPSGGLRPTHAARGYTVWDPATPAYILRSKTAPTLYIPSMFVSYTGEALDRKLPLLRSLAALNKASKKLFAALGETGHNEVWTDSGVEQEFFIIKQDDYYQRPDLVATGRTVQGANPPKTQQFSDHYFAPPPSYAVKFMHQLEKSLWEVGIPLTTRHQEVAPNQFEWAPVFDKSSVASDQNMIAMEIMKRTAENNGLQVLLHEKPFARVNGSGKHNNWSLGSNKIPTFLAPGDKPETNNLFLISVASMMRSIDLYPALFRWAISGASNDYRLGGHEAPPAILSVYLGDYIGAVVDSFINGTPAPPPTYPPEDRSVNYLPKRQADNTDRNRTSPVAFTGNKFELRGVGSSQNPSFSCFVLAGTHADSFAFFAAEIEKAKAGGLGADAAVRKVVTEAFKKHYRVINNGNGYCSTWPAEAKKRGLPNYINTVDALDAVINPLTASLLADNGILSNAELRSHVEVDYTKYAQTVLLEAETLKTLANQYIIPATIKYQNTLLENADSVPASLKATLKGALQNAVDAVIALGKVEEQLAEKLDGDVAKAARFAADTVRPAMTSSRKALDDLEYLVDKSVWPFPSYNELLNFRHNLNSSFRE